MASRPQPVMTKAGLTAAIHAVAVIVGWLGYANTATQIDGETQTLVAVILGAVTLVAHVVPALSARKEVTPVDQPRDRDGTPLVRLDDYRLRVVEASEAQTGSGSADGVVLDDDNPLFDVPEGPDPTLSSAA